MRYLWSPADELNQQTLVVLRTFGFGEEEPKKKLTVYLGMCQSRNAHALLAVSEESICRLGLDKLVQQGIYQVKPDEEINSAILELAQVLDVKQADLTTSQ